jgi:hypothetical protein
LLPGPEDEEVAMCALRLLGSTTAPNVEKMMERLGIDPGFRVVPRFGLLFACALRNCSACIARQACADWLAQAHDIPLSPPGFCPNADLLSELLCDSSIGRRNVHRDEGAQTDA